MLALLLLFTSHLYEPEYETDPDYVYEERSEERPRWWENEAWFQDGLRDRTPYVENQGEFAAWLEEARRRSPRLVLPALEPRPPAPPHLTP